MDITSALSIEKSSTPNFFGGDVARFNLATQVTVRGAVVDLTNTEGVSTSVAAYLTSLMDCGSYQTVTAGGTDLGRLKVVNFSTAASDMVNYGEATIVFEGQAEGDLAPLEDATYYDCFKDSAIFAYAESVSEGWNYSRSANSFVVSHTISLNLKSQIAGGGGDLASPLSAATNVDLAPGLANPEQGKVGTPIQSVGRTFAQKIFNCSGKPWLRLGLDGSMGDINDFPNTWKTTFTQTEDMLANTSSYRKTFTCTNPDIDGEDFCKTRSLSFVRQGDGYVYVSEKGQVESLGDSEKPSFDIEESKSASLAKVKALILAGGVGAGRAEAFFDSLKKEDDKPLVECDGTIKVIRSSYSESSTRPSCDYSLTLTNDIKFSGCDSNSKVSCHESISSDGCYNMKTKSCTFEGEGPKFSGGEYHALNNAVKAYQANKESIVEQPEEGDYSNYPISTQFNKNYMEGRVDFTVQFSESPIYAQQDNGFKQESVQTSVSPSWESKIYFNALNLYNNFDKDIITQDGIIQPETKNISVKLVGDGTTASQDGGDGFFTAACEHALVSLEESTPLFWNSLSYSYTIDPAPTLTIQAQLVE